MPGFTVFTLFLLHNRIQVPGSVAGSLGATHVRSFPAAVQGFWLVRWGAVNERRCYNEQCKMIETMILKNFFIDISLFPLI